MAIHIRASARWEKLKDSESASVAAIFIEKRRGVPYRAGLCHIQGTGGSYVHAHAPRSVLQFELRSAARNGSAIAHYCREINFDGAVRQ